MLKVTEVFEDGDLVEIWYQGVGILRVKRFRMVSLREPRKDVDIENGIFLGFAADRRQYWDMDFGRAVREDLLYLSNETEGLIVGIRLDGTTRVG